MERNDGAQLGAVVDDGFSKILHAMRMGKPTKHPGSKRSAVPRETERSVAQFVARPRWDASVKARAGILDPGHPGIPVAPGRRQTVRQRLPQRCLPPGAVIRRKPLEPTRPLNVDERLARYLLPGGAGLTSAQQRRVAHKRNHAMARARGPQQAATERVLHKTPKGTKQPRSGAMSRGFLKMLGRLRPADRDRALLGRRT